MNEREVQSMKRKVTTGAAVLVLAMIVAACGGSQPQAGNQAGSQAAATPQAGSAQDVLQQINVQMRDIYYGPDNSNLDKPPVWTVKAGETVTLSMDNEGALEHSWAVLKQGEQVPMPYTEANANLLYYNSGNLQPKQQKSDSFTAPTEAGEYIVFCTVAGHYPVMQGRLVVE